MSVTHSVESVTDANECPLREMKQQVYLAIPAYMYVSANNSILTVRLV